MCWAFSVSFLPEASRHCGREDAVSLRRDWQTISRCLCGNCHCILRALPPDIVNAVVEQSHLLQHATTIYLHHAIGDFAEALAAEMPGNLKDPAEIIGNILGLTDHVVMPVGVVLSMLEEQDDKGAGQNDSIVITQAICYTVRAQVISSWVEGSQATAKQMAELLRSVISQQRVPPHSNQVVALINAINGVGEQLINASPVDFGFRWTEIMCNIQENFGGCLGFVPPTLFIRLMGSSFS